MSERRIRMDSCNSIPIPLCLRWRAAGRLAIMAVMTTWTDFERSIAAARQLTAMYAELRRARGLGARGRLNAENQDLLWMPRSAVVAAISAMDAYIHSVLDERIPIALAQPIIPEALAAAMADLLPIKNAASFRQAFPILTASNTATALTARLRDRSLQFLSYQAPDKIIAGYSLIGLEGIFDEVANLWPGPGTTAQEIKNRLANYVKRRNQIAHEGDYEVGGAVRQMQPKYANDCADFIHNLTSRFDRAVYGER